MPYALPTVAFDDAALMERNALPCARLTVCAAFRKSVYLLRPGGKMPTP
jgi:hypothetical protein